jgi:hypothetical protein
LKIVPDDDFFEAKMEDGVWEAKKISQYLDAKYEDSFVDAKHDDDLWEVERISKFLDSKYDKLVDEALSENMAWDDSKNSFSSNKINRVSDDQNKFSSNAVLDIGSNCFNLISDFIDKEETHKKGKIKYIHSDSNINTEELLKNVNDYTKTHLNKLNKLIESKIEKDKDSFALSYLLRIRELLDNLLININNQHFDIIKKEYSKITNLYKYLTPNEKELFNSDIKKIFSLLNKLQKINNK